MRQGTQVKTEIMNERTRARQFKTCQRIGRILRITISMVTKPIILRVLLFGKTSMEKVGRKRKKKRDITRYSVGTIVASSSLLFVLRIQQVGFDTLTIPFIIQTSNHKGCILFHPFSAPLRCRATKWQ